MPEWKDTRFRDKGGALAPEWRALVGESLGGDARSGETGAGQKRPPGSPREQMAREKRAKELHQQGSRELKIQVAGKSGEGERLVEEAIDVLREFTAFEPKGGCTPFSFSLFRKSSKPSSKKNVKQAAAAGEEQKKGFLRAPWGKKKGGQ